MSLLLLGVGRGTAAGAFTPTDLTNLAAWYDPSDDSTVWQDTAGTTAAAVDDPVGRIDDKSGNGHNLLQATAGSRPIRRQDGSGNYYLEFDGTDDKLETSATQPLGATITDAVVFCAFQEATRQDSTLFELSDAIVAQRWLSHAPWGDGKIYFDCGGNTGSNRISVAMPTATGTNMVATFKCSVNDSDQLVRIDGSQVVADATGHSVSTGSGMSMGGSDASFLNGHVYGMIVCNTSGASPASSQEISDAESWLADKAGVTL